MERSNPKVVETLDELTLDWYSKLRDVGFDDIEVQLNSKVPYRRNFPDTKIRHTNYKTIIAQERYVRIIGLLLHDTAFLEKTGLNSNHILVLEGMAEGLTQREIAERTNINKKSVEYYIYKKLKKVIASYASSLSDDEDSGNDAS